MKPPRVISEALGARIAETSPLWYVATSRRSLLAFASPLAVREYVAGCPRYVLMHNDVGAARPVYYAHRSRRMLEEHARSILADALGLLEANA